MPAKKKPTPAAGYQESVRQEGEHIERSDWIVLEEPYILLHRIETKLTDGRIRTPCRLEARRGEGRTANRRKCKQCEALAP